MIYKWVQELCKKYSYITKVETHKGRVFIYYKDLKGEEKHKSLPLRANKEQLIALMEDIRKEINYYENRIKAAKEVKEKIRKSTSAFAYTNGDIK